MFILLLMYLCMYNVLYWRLKLNTIYICHTKAMTAVAEYGTKCLMIILIFTLS